MFIQINLLPGPKKRRGGGGGGGMSFSGLRTAFKQVSDPLLVGAVAAVGAGAAFIVLVFLAETAKLSGLERDLSSARAEAERYEALVRQKQEAQDLRDSLVAELDAIRTIDADRFVWPHILDEVTRALPDFTWLTDLAVLAPAQPQVVDEEADTLPPPPLRFQITGRASDIGGYTQFLRRLANSPWIGSIQPGAATTVVEEQGTRPVYSFTISAVYRQADSAFIQTVPVRESIR